MSALDQFLTTDRIFFAASCFIGLEFDKLHAVVDLIADGKTTRPSAAHPPALKWYVSSSLPPGSARACLFVGGNIMRSLDTNGAEIVAKSAILEEAFRPCPQMPHTPKFENPDEPLFQAPLSAQFCSPTENMTSIPRERSNGRKYRQMCLARADSS